MDFFDDVAALAAGEQEETQLVGMHCFKHSTQMLMAYRFAAHLPQGTAQAEIEKPLHSPPSHNWLKAYLLEVQSRASSAR